MKRVALFLALIPFALLIGSALGPIHPLGDSLAVFRFHIGLVTFVSAGLLFLLKWCKIALGAGILSVAAVGAIWWGYHRQPTSVETPYTLYQKHLSFLSKNAGKMERDIRAKSPDFITFQEANGAHEQLLKTLADEYPSSHYCGKSRLTGTAVSSKFKVIVGSKICSAKTGFAAMQLQTPAGNIWLVSIHLSWPFPHNQAKHVVRITQELATLKGQIVLAGDFNMVPWSQTMAQIETATRTARVGQINGTFRLLDTIDLPIDHVLAPTNCLGTVTTLDLLGSDHHGAFARFTLEAC